MNFSIIEDIVLNLILILFPLLLYLVLICYEDNKNRQKNNILLTITLFTSMYLCFRFGITESNSKVLLFCNIPIAIAYIKKEKVLAIVLSLINILYCYFVFDSLYILAFIKYISYFLIYLYANKKKLDSDNFILIIAVIQGFFLSFEYFFQVTNVSVQDFILLLILAFVYYFATFSSLYIFKFIDKIESLNSTIKILERDKVIKDALFKLTHEIKNPLAVCKGYLSMINLDKREKAEKYISIMEEEIDRSLNIINDFVEFNKIKLVKEQIDLNLLLKDIYDCFEILIKSNNIKLTYHENKQNEIYFMGDYERLKQVIVNLLKNSLESIEQKGEIKLSSITNKKYLEIIVEDNGKGMDKETLSKIKEMFYTTKHSGTGLGVSLSNEIIKAHSGTLTYESEENKGTRAIIKLPYA